MSIAKLNCKKYVISNREIYHMKRVAILSDKLARVVNEEMNSLDISLIKTSGSLHDIGKAYIDPDILNKPGKLTEYEFEIIKNHSIEGAYELITKGYNMEIVNNVLFHHENFDGSGYPFGLKGKSIPVGARIIRICDVYDALTMDRPYRKKMTNQEALKTMDTMKEYFDLEIYEIFKKIK